MEKSNWQKDLEKLLVELGWGSVKGEEPESDRDWNDVKRQCMAGGKVEVGS